MVAIAAIASRSPDAQTILDMPRPPPSPRRGLALTPVAFVGAIVLGYRKYGIDPHAMLNKAGITAEQLHTPGARLTGRQMELASEIAMRELDDEALGWFSKRLHWGTYGMLFRASLSAPRLGLALQRWFRHHRLLIDDIELQLRVHAGTATIDLIERKPLGQTRDFCLLSYLRLIHGYACWMLDSQIALDQVRLSHRQPDDGAVYPLLFSREVEFDAPSASFSFDARYLDLPQVRDDSALRQMLRRPLVLSLRPYRRDRLIVNRVRALLQEDLKRFAHVPAVAEHLRISTRTLHRQFADENASFYQLKDEVRRGLALDLLHGTEKPLKQIALALGFTSEKSFFRAFAKWTGSSPGKIRQQAL